MRTLAALLALSAIAAGCRPNTAGGDTVPTPPRELVEKSFKPPVSAGGPPQPGPSAPR